MALTAEKTAILKDAQKLKREARVQSFKGKFLKWSGKLTWNQRLETKGWFMELKGTAERHVARQVEQMANT